MTPGFWISSITVAGHPTRRDSSVGFESGLNVIYGPSNSCLLYTSPSPRD